MSKTLSRLFLGLAVLGAPAALIGCGEEGAKTETKTPAPAAPKAPETPKAK